MCILVSYKTFGQIIKSKSPRIIHKFTVQLIPQSASITYLFQEDLTSVKNGLVERVQSLGHGVFVPEFYYSIITNQYQ